MIDPLGGPAYLLPFMLAFLAGYAAGSIPFGLVIARLAGAGDIRKIGSGNIGATNVLRTGRKSLALATLAADLIKGYLPSILSYRWLGPDIAVVTALGTVVGHCFPVWLRFKGGKGVATATGVVVALTPIVILPLLLGFALVLWRTRYVSLASLIAAILAPGLAWAMGEMQVAELYALIGLIILAKHHENIGRLLRGRENKLDLARRTNSS